MLNYSGNGMEKKLKFLLKLQSYHTEPFRRFHGNLLKFHRFHAEPFRKFPGKIMKFLLKFQIFHAEPFRKFQGTLKRSHSQASLPRWYLKITALEC